MTLQEDILSRALSLTAKERAEVARQLILSLESGPFDADADSAWEAEIEHRAAEIDRGEAKLVEWRDSVQRIQNAIKRHDSA